MSEVLSFAGSHPWWTTLWLFLIAGFPIRLILAIRGKSEDKSEPGKVIRPGDPDWPSAEEMKATAARLSAEANRRCHDKRCPGNAQAGHECHNLDCKLPGHPCI